MEERKNREGKEERGEDEKEGGRGEKERGEEEGGGGKEGWRGEGG